jgi:glucokinase
MADDCVLAFDLGGTKLAAALLAPAGAVLAEQVELVTDARPRAVVTVMAELASGLRTAAPGASPSAAGVAVPGLARRDGTVWAPNLGWQRARLGAQLEQELRMPVAVDSDRNAAVLGEAWRGAARGRADVVCVMVGTGIGAGILSGGRLVRGAHELSGCAGWMVVGPWERARHGRLGYLESVAAGPAIARAAVRRRGPVRHARRRGPSAGEASAFDVAAAARAGDAVAARAFREAGHQLGLAAGNLVSLFDPEVVVFGGGLAGAAPLWFDAMEQAARATCQPLAARRVKFVVSRLGHRANLLGAARLAMVDPRHGHDLGRIDDVVVPRP